MALYGDKKDLVKDVEYGYDQGGTQAPPAYLQQPVPPVEPPQYTDVPVMQISATRPTGAAEASHDFLWLSIMTTICCCWPLGIVAIVFSVKARSSNLTGNYGDARSNSRAALGFSMASIVCGIIILVLYFTVWHTSSDDERYYSY